MIVQIRYYLLTESGAKAALSDAMPCQSCASRHRKIIQLGFPLIEKECYQFPTKDFGDCFDDQITEGWIKPAAQVEITLHILRGSVICWQHVF